MYTASGISSLGSGEDLGGVPSGRALPATNPILEMLAARSARPSSMAGRTPDLAALSAARGAPAARGAGFMGLGNIGGNIGGLEAILRYMLANPANQAQPAEPAVQPTEEPLPMMPMYLGGGRYGQVPATPEWLAEQVRRRLMSTSPLGAGTDLGGGGNSQGAADSASATGGSIGT